MNFSSKEEFQTKALQLLKENNYTGVVVADISLDLQKIITIFIAINKLIYMFSNLDSKLLLKSGIYLIRNKVNNKVYVGSTVKSLRSRLKRHLIILRLNKHHSAHLQRAYNKYGKESFEFKILEIVDNKNNILQREQYWIDYYKSTGLYNISPTAGSALGIKASEERLAKMRKLKPSEETKRKISISLKERYKEGMLPPANRNKWKMVYQFTKEGVFIQSFPSTMAAARALHLDDTHISACCNHRGKLKTAGGFLFSFNSYTEPFVNKQLRSIKIINTLTNEEKIYNSILDAHRKSKVPKGTIEKALRGNRMMYKIYEVKYTK